MSQMSAGCGKIMNYLQIFFPKTQNFIFLFFTKAIKIPEIALKYQLITGHFKEKFPIYKIKLFHPFHDTHEFYAIYVDKYKLAAIHISCISQFLYIKEGNFLFIFSTAFTIEKRPMLNWISHKQYNKNLTVEGETSVGRIENCFT